MATCHEPQFQLFPLEVGYLIHDSLWRIHEFSAGMEWKMQIILFLITLGVNLQSKLPYHSVSAKTVCVYISFNDSWKFVNPSRHVFYIANSLQRKLELSNMTDPQPEHFCKNESVVSSFLSPYVLFFTAQDIVFFAKTSIFFLPNDATRERNQK